MNFFKSSAIIFSGTFVVNLINYIFTLIMGRMLNVVEFGEMTAMFSMLLIISVPSAAVAMMMTREAAAYSVKTDNSIYVLFNFLKNHVLFAGIGLWIIFIILIPLLSNLLHIHYSLFLIFSFLIPLSLMTGMQTGTLNGLQKFFISSKQSILNTAIKLLVSIGLVYLGFSVSGVMAALVLASLVSWTYGFFVLRSLLKKNKNVTAKIKNKKEIGRLFVSIFATSLLLAFLMNVDLLLAKHFLSPVMAGEYGALSTIGKIIIYGIGAFTMALLPLASSANAKADGSELRILVMSLSVITLCAAAAYAIFSLFPTNIVQLLFGSKYHEIAGYLSTFSLAMGCIAVSIALINYFVAIKNRIYPYLLATGITTEIVLISIYHNPIGTITNMLVCSSFFLLLLLLGNLFFVLRKYEFTK